MYTYTGQPPPPSSKLSSMVVVRKRQVTTGNGRKSLALTDEAQRSCKRIRNIEIFVICLQLPALSPCLSFSPPSPLYLTRPAYTTTIKSSHV